jgi:hypothetical protein
VAGAEPIFRGAVVAYGKADDGRGLGVGMLTELGYIKSGVDDIKAEQREQRKINTEFYSRLAAVEGSAKQAITA